MSDMVMMATSIRDGLDKRVTLLLKAFDNAGEFVGFLGEKNK